MLTGTAFHGRNDLKTENEGPRSKTSRLWNNLAAAHLDPIFNFSGDMGALWFLEQRLGARTGRLDHAVKDRRYSSASACTPKKSPVLRVSRM